MLQLIRKQYNNDYVMKRNGSPKKMQRTEQMCHISKPNNLSNSDVHNGPAHYYEDIAPSSNIGNSDVHNGPAHYYEDIAASSNIGNSDVHNGPAIIMRTLPRVQTLATLMFTMVQLIIMWTLPRVQTLELSTIQGSDKEHLEAKPQLWKLVYRSASGYRNAIPSWIKRRYQAKQMFT
ncbi:uncharacterized protein LOC128241536 isoform X2 [Mya arenaria]|uniref:uncharacterized protein LOC128241536 isoform X2 n=2 Tax=Mya arenaria TaxID=6604 RepID=UPI0022E88655|nr:uncharacterized protein LOC128241536 isoform X2 [Mya arenaria]